jgi:hypothetical protein
MRTGLVLQLGLLCLGSLVLAQDDTLTRALAAYPECAVSHAPALPQIIIAEIIIEY